MVPFNVEMETLYQKFIAKWLESHLPERFEINRRGIEETVTLTEFAGRPIQYRIDIVLYDRELNEPIAVIDAKYKTDERPEPSDISQMVGYAKAVETGDAFLVYPAQLEDSLDFELGNVHIRNIEFNLENDLNSNGLAFLEELSTELGHPALSPS